MHLTIRQGTVADAALLARLQYVAERAAYFNFMPGQQLVDRPARDWEAWLECWPPFARMASPRIILIAEIDGESAGFAAVRHGTQWEGYDADLIGLYVDPAHTRQGVGGRLFAEVCRYLLSQNIHTLIVEAFEENPYRSFYDKLGGKIIGPVGDDCVAYGFENIRQYAILAAPKKA